MSKIKEWATDLAQDYLDESPVIEIGIDYEI